jgi:dynactin 1
VDFYIELLRKDQLDENVPFEAIEKSLNYFQQIYQLQGHGQGQLDHVQVLSDSLKTYNSASDCLSQLTSMVKIIMTTNDNTSEMADLIKV